MKLPIPLLCALLAACAPAVKAPQDSPPARATTAPAPAIVVADSAAKSVAPAPPKTASAVPPATPSGAPRKPPTPVAKTEGPAPAAKPEGPAPLDLKTLEEQLKQTSAIGVMTKLSLKNQVDDLLDQFRAYYQGRIKTTLAELRRPYELLLMKVLAVLQDGDPALAHAINASREAIWGILADRDTFAKVAA